MKVYVHNDSIPLHFKRLNVSGENSASASLEFLLNVLSTKREKLYPIFQLTCNSSSPTQIDNLA